MNKITTAIAAVAFTATFGAMSDVQAHSSKQCVKELQAYAASCKFSPTAWLLGFCKNKKAQKWCSDKKLHDDKFHK